MEVGRGNRLPVLNQGSREQGGGGRKGEKKREETLGWREEGTRDNLIQLQTRRPGR